MASDRRAAGEKGLDWDIQAEAPPRELLEPTEEPAEAPRGARAGLARFWLGYVLVLLVGALLGFLIGRGTEARAAVAEGIDAALRLEELAFRRGDAELYAATLDGDAPPGWLADRMATFRGRPEIDLGRAQRIERLATDRVRVTLEDSEDGLPPDIERLREYRLSDGRWLRSPAADGDLESDAARDR